jgi:hypothetical protein
MQDDGTHVWGALAARLDRETCLAIADVDMASRVDQFRDAMEKDLFVPLCYAVAVIVFKHLPTVMLGLSMRIF